MIRYLVLRVGQAIAVLWAAFTVSFAVLYLLPGDPVEVMTAGGMQASTVGPAQIAALRHQYGLDKPVPVQYWDRLIAALHGDFGQSIANGANVSGVIGQSLPQSLVLTLAALLLAVSSGSVVALLATYTDTPWLRRLLLALPSVGASVPTFWVGLMLIELFSFQLRLFPAIGGTGITGLVLPAITLAVPAAAAIAQVLARSLRDTTTAPYIDTARAKGAGRIRVHLRHALPNATIPALTVLGLLIGDLITNAVVIETVFSRAGLGRITASAVNARDIPLVQGVVVLGAAVVVVVNLLVDLIYPLLDPRIVLTGRPA
ncbi:MAG TPA: ABC transporter permease [Pseudonocardiaceae bacterium]|jgi:peptide/nickel transport system permease protein